MIPLDGFDYRTADASAILARATGLRGRRIGEISEVTFTAHGAVHGKGEVGHAVEAFFGIPPNPRREADFPGAGVELKVVPMVRSARELRIKERTVLGMIDYGHLVHEDWATASVRKKLRILFVFFEHLADRPKSLFPLVATLLWEPDSATLDFIRDDWRNVREKVRDGLAHELSEADGRIMGPCTKGPGGGRVRPQPNQRYAKNAKSRAFSLKPSFTKYLYEVAIGRAATESLVERLGIRSPGEFEARVLTRFAPFVGQTIDEVAREMGVPASTSKDHARRVAMRALGASSPSARIREFEETGLTVRVFPMDMSGRARESVSFPAFKHMELIEEDWQDSEVLSIVEYMLFVPHYRARNDPIPHARFGLPLFWRPSSEEMETMEREWTMFRDLIARGRADRLPPASGTRILHVRPHGRDRSDTDPAPLVGPVVRKSFWLNGDFVAGLVDRRGGPSRK